jgi:hypothetical protein
VELGVLNNLGDKTIRPLPSIHGMKMKEGCMARRIKVRGTPRPEPDVRLYVLALIELARQLQEEEAAGKRHKQVHGDDVQAFGGATP